MPPKAKFSRKEIIDNALQIVRESGLKGITARSLGNKLGSSARPIFTIFQSMEEVIDATIDEMYNIFDAYIKEGLEEDISFKGSGKSYIRFAKEEPAFFQIIFMHSNDGLPKKIHLKNTTELLFSEITESIQKDYGLEKEDAFNLYLNMWIFCHGIATLMVTKMIEFTDDDISNRLTEVFQGQLSRIKQKYRK
ncbi:MAG: TetR/AcrR family transcriptional regulator [Bacilli bacterium]